MAYSSTRRAAVISLGACLAPGFTLAQDSPTSSALRKGGHVLLIRHARAPGTFDPPEFKLGVCSTQRNLNDEGRAQAKRLGEFIRNMQVPIGRVFSSEWCRCIETAQLAFGSDKVTTQATLSSPTKLSPEQRARHTELVRSQINRHAAGSAAYQTNLVMVTHMFNIQDITGEGAAEGEILVVKSTKAGVQNPIQVVGRISTQ
jgi:phosphohistidine phosphatase SixA